jgi:stalled ribosome alternative rescue factor ArfA
MAVTSRKGPARPKKRASRMMKPKKTVKRRSAAAAALATPVFRKRVVKNAKAYRRKGKTDTTEGDDGAA